MRNSERLARNVAPVERLLLPPPSWPPTIVVVVDTEEEFDWHAPFDPASNSVRNISLQPLSQRIFDEHGIIPTYVIDYPVASSTAAVAILRRFADEGRCEIGTHLHPWVNPPAEGLIDARHSYPGNLPVAIEQRKLVALTNTIQSNLGRNPKVYKAGRYGIGTATPRLLRELGYEVDVSVVPHTDFSYDSGPDFRGAPATPFVITEGVCELPLSVHFVGRLAPWGPRLFPYLRGRAASRLRLAGICGRLGLLERLRLSPEGHTLTDMVRQTRAAVVAGTRLFMLTYHSSSLLPGATDYVRTEDDQSAFLARLEGYVRFFLHDLGGRTDTVARVAAALVTEKRPAG